VEAHQVKKGSFLDHLMKGITDAMVQAEALSQAQHIESLKKYFKDDGEPKCMPINIAGEKHQIPLVTLAPQNSIKMKEVKMKLKVKLSNYGKRKSRLGGGIFKDGDAGAVSVDLGSSILPFKNNYADLEITFEGTDPPEGVVRLNNNLIKQIP
tara:strand:+ start:15254 stop:15712 length:459 start_codon:yes stop_codon:yes gene_type:complete